MGTHQTIGLIGSRQRPEFRNYLRPDHDGCLLDSFQWIGKILITMGLVLALPFAWQYADQLLGLHILLIAAALLAIAHDLRGKRVIAWVPLSMGVVRAIIGVAGSKAPLLEVGFLIFSAALPFLAMRNLRRVSLGQLTSFLALSVAMAALVLRFLRAESSVHGTETALMMILSLYSAGGLLLRPEAPPISVFALDSYAGEMSRRLLPSVVAITLLSAWLRLEAESLGWLGARTGVAVFTVITIWLLASAIYLTCRSLSQTDAVLRLASDISNMARERLDREVTKLAKSQTDRRG
jgi:hypothetical protein